MEKNPWDSYLFLILVLYYFISWNVGFASSSSFLLMRLFRAAGPYITPHQTLFIHCVPYNTMLGLQPHPGAVEKFTQIHFPIVDIGVSCNINTNIPHVIFISDGLKMPTLYSKHWGFCLRWTKDNLSVAHWSEAGHNLLRSELVLVHS